METGASFYAQAGEWGMLDPQSSLDTGIVSNKEEMYFDLDSFYVDDKALASQSDILKLLNTGQSEVGRVDEQQLQAYGVSIDDHSSLSSIYSSYSSEIMDSYGAFAAAAANFACCAHGPMESGVVGNTYAMPGSAEAKQASSYGEQIIFQEEAKCRSCKGAISASQRICAPGIEKHYCTLCAKSV